MSTPLPDDHTAARAEKLARIAALGVDPWGQRFDGHTPIAGIRAQPAVSFDNSPTDGELGLLSLEFHPGFATNGIFFVDYIAPNGSVWYDRLAKCTSRESTRAGTIRVTVTPRPAADSRAVISDSDGMKYGVVM